MKNENVIKMARLMVGCTDRTCEDCLSQSKKLFGDNKCALIEYAEVLDNAGYRKESEVAKEFADKLNEKIQLKRDSKEDFMRPNTIKALEFWANEWRNKCIDISKFIKEVAKEYGVEDEKI